MECGGKRSATPLWFGREALGKSFLYARAKAVSPLRFATAVPDHQLKCICLFGFIEIFVMM
jgi:hypothetical protein